MQKLKDKEFGAVPQFVSHTNPEAKVETSIEQYKEYSIEEAYKGNNLFWGVHHHVGDYVTFEMTPPVKISSIKIVSGNLEHPLDHFYNTTVELLLDSVDFWNNSEDFWNNSKDFSNKFEKLSDNFIVVGGFDILGVFQTDLTFDQNVSQIRISVHNLSENWVIISEIEIKTS